MSCSSIVCNSEGNKNRKKFPSFQRNNLLGSSTKKSKKLIGKVINLYNNFLNKIQRAGYFINLMANNKEKKTIYGTSEKEREIKRLENSALRRLNKNYADELYDLLYFSKDYNDNDYNKKRADINKNLSKEKNCKTIDAVNNKIYIPLTRPKIKLTSITNKKEKNKNENKIIKFLMNKQESSGLYEQLNTKNNINSFKHEKLNSINSGNLKLKKMKNISLPKLNYPSSISNNSIRNKKFNKPIKLDMVSGLEKNSAKFLEQNLFYDKLTNNEKRDLKYICELKLLNYIDQQNEKYKLINEIKGYEKDKKKLKEKYFNFNKEKCQKHKKSRNENEIVINKLNNENKKYLYGLENMANILHSESNDAEKDVTNHLNNMDIFFNKNGISYNEKESHVNSLTK